MKLHARLKHKKFNLPFDKQTKRLFRSVNAKPN